MVSSFLELGFRVVALVFGLFLQDQPPLIVAAVKLLLRDLQHEFFRFSAESANQPEQLAVRTIPKDLDGVTVYPPRRLSPRTYGILEIARLAVEV